MKPVHNYCVIVDHYRARYARQRASAGRYRVGAKTPDEARQLVKDVIGFGSPVVYFAYPDDDPKNVPYKKVVREISEGVIDGKMSFKQEEAKHATAPQERKNKDATD